MKEKNLAANFVNASLEAVDKGFPLVVGLINDSPEFKSSPQLSEKDDSRFLLIVLAANLREIPKHLEAHQDNRLIADILQLLSEVFNTPKDELEMVLREYQSYLKRVNHPSNNTLYAMSKAVFYKYKLGSFQEEYFKHLNSPNPMFLKRLDDAMSNFLYDWEAVRESYTLVE